MQFIYNSGRFLRPGGFSFSHFSARFYYYSLTNSYLNITFLTFFLIPIFSPFTFSRFFLLRYFYAKSPLYCRYTVRFFLVASPYPFAFFAIIFYFLRVISVLFRANYSLFRRYVPRWGCFLVAWRALSP